MSHRALLVPIIVASVLLSLSGRVGAAGAPDGTARYSGPWPHASDFQASEGWTGAVPSGADAATIDLTWARVEPSRGVFNWSVYDRELAQIASQGKRAILILWYLQKGSGSSSNSQAAPGYVWQDLGGGGSVYDGGGGSLIPDYYAPAFLADWHSYLAAVAAHFAASPNVGDIVYVRGLTGKGGETTPCLGHGFTSDSVCASHESAWGPTHNANADWMHWLVARTDDEAAAFSYASVVTPVDAWDGGARDPSCTLPDAADCLYHNEWVYQQALVTDASGAHPFIPGSNALPNNTGQVQGVLESIRKHIPGVVHIEFQEQTGATSSGASVGEAITAWCYSESDPDVVPGLLGAADVEFYSGVYAKGYAGPHNFAAYETGAVDPGADASVCAGK